MEEEIQPATVLKVTLLHGCFSRYLCTNGTKYAREASCKFHIVNLKFTGSHNSSKFGYKGGDKIFFLEREGLD